VRAVTRRVVPVAAAITAGAAMAVTAAGCSSPSSSSSSSSSTSPNPSASDAAQQRREEQLESVIVACLLRHGVIPARDVSHQSWYRGGHVTPNDAFAFWFRDYSGFPVNVDGDQHLSDMVRNASDGDWPTGTCGPAPSR
jgi:hypothetical protein